MTTLTFNNKFVSAIRHNGITYRIIGQYLYNKPVLYFAQQIYTRLMAQSHQNQTKNNIVNNSDNNQSSQLISNLKFAVGTTIRTINDEHIPDGKHTK